MLDKDTGTTVASISLVDRRPLPSADVADNELMERMARGDRHALDALYRRHGGLALALAQRMTGDRGAAEDAVQDAFVALWRRAAEFDGRRCAPRTWLLTIVRNRCIDELRRRALAAQRTASIDEQPAALDVNPWPEIWKRSCGSAIRSALAELPAEQREVVELGFYGDLSHSQIATQLGAPLGTVKKRMRSGLKRLRTLLDNLFYESVAP